MERNSPGIAHTKRQRPTGIFAALAISIVTLSIASCVQVRLLTYPSEFTWIEPASVKGAMHEMALSMSKLDQYVQQAAKSPNDQVLQREIFSELDLLDTLALSLSKGASADGQTHPATNHLLIDEHIDEFNEQLLRARLMAEAEPANYYGIGRLTGGCTACHQLR